MNRVYAQIVPPGTLALSNDASAVCAAQIRTTPGDLLLNGSLVVDGVATFAGSQQVSLAGTGLSSVTFTVWGTNVNGGFFKEDIAGPSLSPVTTLNYFKTVVKVTINVPMPALTSVTVGVLSSNGAGIIIPMNYRAVAFNASYTVVIGGSASVEIDLTANNPQRAGETLNWIKLAGPLSASTVTQSFAPVYGVKCFTTTYVSGGVEFIVLESGYALGG